MTTPFRRTTDCLGRFRHRARALPPGRRSVRRSRWPSRMRWDSATPLPAPGPPPRMRTPCGINPAGLARLNFPQAEAGDPRDHPVVPSSRTRTRRRRSCSRWAARAATPAARAFVPNLYGSMAINDSIHVGIGVNVPFGLKTEYDDGWLGRYQALKSEVKTININPAMS